MIEGSISETRSVAETLAPIPSGGWSKVPISRIEDLEDAVLGAGLDAIQMSRAPISGSLAFAVDRDITYSSGFLDGHIMLTGPLSETMVTIGVGLHLSPGTRHWLNEVPSSGAMGVFLAGDVHESIYTPGSLYATATLSFERLEEVAAYDDLVLDARQLGGTGLSSRPMTERWMAPLLSGFTQVHERDQTSTHDPNVLGRQLLDALIKHFSREPRRAVGAWAARQHGRVVERARRYIMDHLERPLSIDALAQAAFTSRRTLHRAFLDVLGETPQSYVRKLRLNRIRHDLATEREAICTITLIANRWGISELGRLSAWYCDLFGELPSETRARSHASIPSFVRETSRMAQTA